MTLSQTLFGLALSASPVLFAQIVAVPPPPGKSVDDVLTLHKLHAESVAIMGEAGEMGPAGGMIRFMSAEFGVSGKTVKGAPYTAQAVTETTQTLADGNRIVHKSTALLARDSEGRTRREQHMDAVGPWAGGDQPAPLIFISDPVTQSGYILEANTKTARKMGDPRMDVQYKAVKDAPAGLPAAPEDVVTEPLGSKMVEGVPAEGKRFTRTIPARQIGNERPLVFVNETWYSPELQMMISSRHSDPQNGETIYKLTNIQRAEPDPTLFTVPADYQVKESGKTQIILDKVSK